MALKKIKAVINLIKFISAYKKGESRLNYPPLRVWIEPTNYCNLKCLSCPNSYLDKKISYMDLSLYEKIISEIKNGVFEVNLFLGGESLFHPRIDDFINIAKSADLKVNLHTNATVLDKAAAQKLLNTGLDVLSFSFEGYSKPHYENLRRRARYEAVKENILNFLKLKKIKKKKKPVTVLQVLRKGGEPEDLFTREFIEAGVNAVRFVDFHDWAGNIKGFGMPCDKNVYNHCEFFWYSISVLSDGSVVPCCSDFTGLCVLGDAKSDDILDVWNNEKSVGLREKLRRKENKQIGLCSNCGFLHNDKPFGMPAASTESFLEAIFGFNAVNVLVNAVKPLVKRKKNYA